MRGLQQGQPQWLRDVHFVMRHWFRASDRQRAAPLRHVYPAVDVEHVAGDVAGFLAGEKHNGRGDLGVGTHARSEEHTSELQSLAYLVCRLLLEKKKKEKYFVVRCGDTRACVHRTLGIWF